MRRHAKLGNLVAMRQEWLIVFVKAPRNGQVKTRLAQAIGPDAATRAYQTLTGTLLHGLRGLAKIQLRFAPDESEAEIRPWLRPGWTTAPQGSGDLGARLQRGFAEAFAAGAKRVVVIGSDCPEVGAADVEAAWHGLRTSDVVVGPATDGGYWLIGLQSPQPDLFQDMPWSTPALRAETLARAKSAGLQVKELRELSDVDTIEDWQRFLARTPV